MLRLRLSSPVARRLALSLAMLLLAGCPPSPPKPVTVASPVSASDTMIRRIDSLESTSSELYDLAQALDDSLGPRLTGSPQQQAAISWAISRYTAWGIPAHAESYGTWRAWTRGPTHVDLIAPRVRTLEAVMRAWSPGTKGTAEGDVVVLPGVSTPAEFAQWLPQAKGKWVLIAFPQPTCRPDSNWTKWGLPERVERMEKERADAESAWTRRVAATGVSARDLPDKLEEAEAQGVFSSQWSRGWGVIKVFGARTQRLPVIELSCEDYGLLFRLADRGQHPRVRVNAESSSGADTPVSNVVAELRGREKPDEYVMLSAHFDSWDASSGATDNGTGTVVMMEAMRILKLLYPQPKRTILAGHWSGEEQGLNGSRAFAADHPEIVKGLAALFNQDNGTGRVATISMQGLSGADRYFQHWLEVIPATVAGGVKLVVPGVPQTGGTDNASFICYGAPAFSLSSTEWDYRTYTWHTDRDTFDKIAWEDLEANAKLVAMLAFLASEAPSGVPRDRVPLKDAKTGASVAWPKCTEPLRDPSKYAR